MSNDLIILSPTDPEPSLTTGARIAMITPADRARHAPDRTLILARGGVLAARLSCWWEGTPRLHGSPVGIIGHYAAVDREAGTYLLDRACELLTQHGRTAAVGPMDGNTWRRYRFVVDRGDEPPFFLEPDNPDDDPNHWTASGFAPLAHYHSALNPDISTLDTRTDAAIRALKDRHRTIITPADLSEARRVLERIYELSLAAFADSFLYTPIGRDEFVAQYQAVLPHVRPELVLLATRDEELVGYLFALPDLLRRARGEADDTVILKTLGVSPSARGLGLGGALLDLAQRHAHALGYRRAIHALIHEGNISGRISGRYARPMRRYALFMRRLDS